MSFLASFMNLAGPDLIVILLIILVLFGAKKLPELARGMGQAVKEFQKAKDEFSDELHKAGKSDTEVAKSDVKPAQATVARTDNQITQLLPETKPIRFSRNRGAKSQLLCAERLTGCAIYGKIAAHLCLRRICAPKSRKCL